MKYTSLVAALLLLIGGLAVQRQTRADAQTESDILVPGAYYRANHNGVDDAEAHATPAIVRVVNGQYVWHLGVFEDDGAWIGAYLITWGVSTDRIVPSRDFDRDDLDDITVYRPATGVWYVLQSSCLWQCYSAYQVR